MDECPVRPLTAEEQSDMPESVTRMRVRLAFDTALDAGSFHRVVIALPDGLCFVADLLAYLRRRFEIQKSPEEFLLAVDGFALLESDRLDCVLHDGDTINVRESAKNACQTAEELPAQQTAKRKAPQDMQSCKRRLVADGSLLKGLASNLHVDQIPMIDPWVSDAGCLVDALSLCGAVFVNVSHSKLPVPDFSAWRELCTEAVQRGDDFWRRCAVKRRMLKFQQGEDLSRTLEGESKEYMPDVRYNFGVIPDSVLSASMKKDWGELAWIQRNFKSTLAVLKSLLQRELGMLLPSPEQAAKEPKGTLGSKILNSTENWGSTRLRHSVYPACGSCTEHTDYGVVTLQQSTSDGLEAEVHGHWRSLHPPEGCALIFAGDMLERLTNGEVHALKHRVRLKHRDEPSDGTLAVRQAHIVFLQPDKNTVVQPLQRYLRGNETDLPAVRYRDWHHQKTSLAFKHQGSAAA